MKTRNSIVSLFVISLTFLASLPLSARPRTPLPPLPELAPMLLRLDFDEPYWQGVRDAALVCRASGCGRACESCHSFRRSAPVV
jgi:hypothetical protein